MRRRDRHGPSIWVRPDLFESVDFLTRPKQSDLSYPSARRRARCSRQSKHLSGFLHSTDRVSGIWSIVGSSDMYHILTVLTPRLVTG